MPPSVLLYKSRCARTYTILLLFGSNNIFVILVNPLGALVKLRFVVDHVSPPSVVRKTPIFERPFAPIRIILGLVGWILKLLIPNKASLIPSVTFVQFCPPSVVFHSPELSVEAKIIY